MPVTSPYADALATVPVSRHEVEVAGVNVIVDYCHNAPGMRMLGDFVDRVGDPVTRRADVRMQA